MKRSRRPAARGRNGALLALAAGLFVGLAPAISVDRASSAAAQDDVVRSTYHDYRVVTVADGLINPWSMAFLPGGDLLVTERPGRLRIVRNGTLLPDPVPGVPEVLAVDQGGLMEVAVHPNFASNRIIYLSYSKPLGRVRLFFLRMEALLAYPDRRRPHATTAVVRGIFENDRFTLVDEVFEMDPSGGGGRDSTAVGWPSTPTATCS